MTRVRLLATGGMVAAFALAGAPQALAAEPLSTAATSATTITVTMTEFKLALSKRVAPVGTVVFRLVNRGTIPHDFRIAGKRSARIQPGARGTLRVVFRKPGRYSFLCTVPGHAAAGQKGMLTVATRVSVVMGRPTEFRFTLSRRRVPRGPVLFNLVNRGSIAHDFRIARKRSKVIRPGRRGTLLVVFTRRGTYRVTFVCTLPGHREAGMTGTLTVG